MLAPPTLPRITILSTGCKTTKDVGLTINRESVAITADPATVTKPCSARGTEVTIVVKIAVATKPADLASSVKITSDPAGCTYELNQDNSQTATCTGTYSDTTKFTFTGTVHGARP
jgi:hypothetical protein